MAYSPMPVGLRTKRVVVGARLDDYVGYADFHLDRPFHPRLIGLVRNIAKNVLRGDLARDSSDGVVDRTQDRSGVPAGSDFELVISFVGRLGQKSRDVLVDIHQRIF